MNFEEKCDRLQEIVKSLEKGDVGLKDATKLFEEGVKIAKECQKELDESRGKLTILKNELDSFADEE